MRYSVIAALTVCLWVRPCMSALVQNHFISNPVKIMTPDNCHNIEAEKSLVDLGIREDQSKACFIKNQNSHECSNSELATVFANPLVMTEIMAQSSSNSELQDPLLSSWRIIGKVADKQGEFKNRNLNYWDILLKGEVLSFFGLRPQADETQDIVSVVVIRSVKKAAILWYWPHNWY